MISNAAHQHSPWETELCSTIGAETPGKETNLTSVTTARTSSRKSWTKVYTDYDTVGKRTEDRRKLERLPSTARERSSQKARQNNESGDIHTKGEISYRVRILRGEWPSRKSLSSRRDYTNTISPGGGPGERRSYNGKPAFIIQQTRNHFRGQVCFRILCINAILFMCCIALHNYVDVM